MSKGKILVVRGGAIGDFILTLPALAALRRQFPGAHLEVIGYPHIVQLALAGGLVDRVQAIEARAMAGFFARNGELAEDLSDYFSEFNLIISYLYDPDQIFQTNVRRCAHGQFIAGPHRPVEHEPIHATRVYLKPLERLAIFDADPVPRLAISAYRSPQAVLALHPGSGSEHKNWPMARWAELLTRLARETEFHYLLVGGEAEGDRLRRLAGLVPAARRQVAQSLPLTELAARLQACAGFVGHDSGITHLAVALGLPALVLWANTVAEIWRPQGERVTILREGQGVASISVGRVLRELGAMVDLKSQSPG
jgi:ADP-heptose:LPS heptosyltransferase